MARSGGGHGFRTAGEPPSNLRVLLSGLEDAASGAPDVRRGRPQALERTLAHDCAGTPTHGGNDRDQWPDAVKEQPTEKRWSQGRQRYVNAVSQPLRLDRPCLHPDRADVSVVDGDSPPHASGLGITQASLAEEDGHGLFGVGPARRPNHAGASKHAPETTGHALPRQGINSLGGSRRGPRGPTRQTPRVPPTSGRTQTEIQAAAAADPPVRRCECRRRQMATICRRWNRRCIFHAGWRIDRKLETCSEVRSPSCAITPRRPRDRRSAR